VTALGIAFAAGLSSDLVLLLVTPQLLIRHHPHRSPAPMTDLRPHPTTWTAPGRLPSRHELQPASLPADLEALVRSGHLTEVEPGRYRRGPRRPVAPLTAPTPRQQYDRHADCIAAAVLDRAADTALAAHVAARALLDRHSGPRPCSRHCCAQRQNTSGHDDRALDHADRAADDHEHDADDHEHDTDQRRARNEPGAGPDAPPPGQTRHTPGPEPVRHSRCQNTRGRIGTVRRAHRPRHDPEKRHPGHCPAGHDHK